MSLDYIPLLVLFLLAGVFSAIAIVVPSVLGPKRPTKTKLAPVESGMIPFHDAHRRFPVQYYVVAVLFILFDIEVIFLYPWAVAYNQLGLFALVEVIIFLGILAVGLAYAWAHGDLQWS